MDFKLGLSAAGVVAPRLLGRSRSDGMPESVRRNIEASRCGKNIRWKALTKSTKKWLITRLADLAEEVPHPRGIAARHFLQIVIPELGTTLLGMYSEATTRYPDKVIENLLDEVGIDKLAALTWATQLSILRSWHPIQWARVPDSTRVRLLDALQEQLQLPHARRLGQEALKEVRLECLGVTLSSLYEQYRERRPDDYAGATINYMFDQLGIPEEPRAREFTPVQTPFERNPLLLAAIRQKRAGGASHRNLSDEEIDYLLLAARADDAEAMDLVIWAFEPLMIKIARRALGLFPYSAINVNALVQEGRGKMVLLVKRYDPQRGFKFITFAWKSLFFYFLRYIDQETAVIPVPNQEKIKHVWYLRALRKFRAANGRDPSDEEITKALLGAGRGRGAIKIVPWYVPEGESRRAPEERLSAPTDPFAQVLAAHDLERMLREAELTAGQARVVYGRYLLGLSFSDIGRRWGEVWEGHPCAAGPCSRENIRRLHAGAMEKLRATLA